jgi:hypothetical protein
VTAATFLLALFAAVCAAGWWDALRVARAAIAEGEKLQALAVAHQTDAAEARPLVKVLAKNDVLATPPGRLSRRTASPPLYPAVASGRVHGARAADTVHAAFSRCSVTARRT